MLVAKGWARNGKLCRCGPSTQGIGNLYGNNSQSQKAVGGNYPSFVIDEVSEKSIIFVLTTPVSKVGHAS